MSRPTCTYKDVPHDVIYNSKKKKNGNLNGQLHGSSKLNYNATIWVFSYAVV